MKLTPTRRRALEIVRDEDRLLRLDQLADMIGGPPPRMTRTYNLLYDFWRAGWVIFDGDKHMKAFDIQITPAGLAALEEG